MLKKIIGPVIIVSLLWVAISAATTLHINWLVDSHLQILEEDVAAIEAAGEMRVTLRRLNTAAVLALTNPEEGTKTSVPDLINDFRRHLHAAEATFEPDDQAEKTAVAAILERFEAYERYILESFERASSPDYDSADDVAQIRVLLETVAGKCRDYIALNKRQIAEATAYSSRLQTLMMRARLVFVVAGPLIGIVFGVIVARGLRSSVSQINVTLQSATNELEQAVGHVQIAPSNDLPALKQQIEVVCEKIKEVVAELNETRSHAVRADRLAAVGEVAAGVAHEIRNPLTSVKLLVQVAAQRHQVDALNGDHLRVIEGEIARIENIIQSLLDFAKPPEPNRVRHDLRDTVRGAVDLVEARAKQCGISMLVTNAESPAIIEGDPEQLRQVLVNLLLNGIESMPAGGTLQIATTAGGGANSACQVAICDTGPGVPNELLERIFDPFFTTRDRGTGLGLAVSRRIVQEHGGDLTAHNREGGGAVFLLQLPNCGEQTPSALPDEVRDSIPNPVEFADANAAHH